MKLASNEAIEPTATGGNHVTARRRPHYLRPNRIAIREPISSRITATASNAATGNFEANVVDLSLHGLRLMLPSREQRRPALLGDRLEPLTIHCDGRVVYQGVGTVTRKIDREEQIELGVELQQAAVDLESVYRASARQDVLQRWQQELVELRTKRISADFRAWVAELAAFLETAKRFLDHEEAVLDAWDLATRRAVSDELLNAVAPDIIAGMNRAGDELGRLVSNLPKDAHASYRAFLHMQLGGYFATSPFLARAKRKPLGYAGDYEMMNMLYRDHREGASLFGKALNLYATQLPVARANINRIEYLGKKIRRIVERTDERRRARVVSIGCGPAHEIFSLLSSSPELGERLDIVLIDQEERAIAHCERSLAPLASRTNAKVRVIRESARHLLTDRKLGDSLGRCDLVYSAGLFDYLAGRSFGALLSVLYGSLVERGSLIIGNVAASNPDQWAMEYFTEWFLNHRSPSELLHEASALSPAPMSAEIEAEPLGVNLFLVIER